MDKLLSRALPLPDVRNPRNARAAAAVRLTCCPSVLVLLDILRTSMSKTVAANTLAE